MVRQVQRIPVEDHCPPLLIEVVRFCEDVTSWMRRDPRNVIAAHCKVRLPNPPDPPDTST
jgi:hypothetical protein